MAEFRWVIAPDHGVCNACGTSTNDRGFVNFIGDVVVRSPEGDVTGIVDAYYCGGCLEQASRYVGCASRADVQAMSYAELEVSRELEKTRDEVKAWQQRHETLLGNLSDTALEKFSEPKIIQP